MFVNNQKQVAEIMIGLRQTLREERDKRTFIIASLFEKEIGLLQTIIENLFEEGQVSFPDLFLVLRSPDRVFVCSRTVCGGS